MPYGKGTYGNQVGRPAKKKVKKTLPPFIKDKDKKKKKKM